MKSSDWIATAAIVLVVGAVWLGRSKGRAAFSSAVADARAAGYATAKAELTAIQTVNVQTAVSGGGAVDELGLRVRALLAEYGFSPAFLGDGVPSVGEFVPRGIGPTGSEVRGLLRDAVDEHGECGIFQHRALGFAGNVRPEHDSVRGGHDERGLLQLGHAVGGVDERADDGGKWGHDRISGVERYSVDVLPDDDRLGRVGALLHAADDHDYDGCHYDDHDDNDDGADNYHYVGRNDYNDHGRDDDNLSWLVGLGDCVRDTFGPDRVGDLQDTSRGVEHARDRDTRAVFAGGVDVRRAVEGR